MEPESSAVSGVVDARSLGLAAFATTTFVYGLSYTTIWSPGSSAAMALTLALVYGGAIQILAGIWAFGRRQTFPAVVYCSFGAFYVSYYVFVHTVASGLSGADLQTATSVYLLAWLILSAYILVAAARVTPATGITYFFWWLSYLLLVIGEFLGNSNVIIGGGAAAIASAGAAWYVSAALLINDSAGKKVLQP
jgi:hypothetical protein